MTEDTQAPQLHCPTCRAILYWTDAYPFRPFCSERCKLIDLGEWASEGHRIPGKPLDWQQALDSNGLGSNGEDGNGEYSGDPDQF